MLSFVKDIHGSSNVGIYYAGISTGFVLLVVILTTATVIIVAIKKKQGRLLNMPLNLYSHFIIIVGTRTKVLRLVFLNIDRHT